MKDHLLIFDIDGTLTNTTGVDDECIEQSLREALNMEVNSLDWSAFTHPTDEGILNQILDGRAEKNVDFLKQKVKEVFLGRLDRSQQDHPEKFSCIPGSLELLNILKELEHPIAIATGSWKKSGEIKLRSLPKWVQNLPYAHCDDHYARVHIAKTAQERAEGHYGISRWSTITYFGDGLWDLHTAKENGYHFIGIDFLRTLQLDPHGADHIFETWENPDTVLEVLSSQRALLT